MKGSFDLRNKKILAANLTIQEVVYWVAFIFSIMMKCFYFQFTTQINSRPFFSYVNLLMLGASLGILLIITAAVIFLFNQKRLIALFACQLLLTSLLIADTNFFRYYYGILTIPVLMQVDVSLLSSVDQSIMSLFKLKDLLYILDIPLFLAGLIILYRKDMVGKVYWNRKMAFSFALLFIGFMMFTPVYVNADTEKFGYNSNYVAKNLGVLYSHYDSISMFAKENFFEKKSLTQEEKAAIKNYLSKRISEVGSYHGIAKGKSLIVIQAEALQQFVINRKVNGHEITPNLNKLIKDSLYFDNIYYQVAGGNTSDAEFLCNTSLYPVNEGAVYMRFPQNIYNSLPNILKKQGYSSYAFHAFDAEFWNRTEMYKTIGFDTFYNGDSFIQDDFAGWEGNALSDKSFFRQSLDRLDPEKPFYGFFITLSSHHPFNYFENYSFDVGEYEGTYMGNYLKAANYADSALGQFIDGLKSKGLYDDALLVVYGDHSAVPKHLASELYDFTGTEYSDTNWIKLQKVPLIIHYPGLENGKVINTTGGQIDLLPTIANLMGFKAETALGKDLLNTGKGYAVLRNGSVITDSYAYLSNLGEAYNLNSGKRLDAKEYEAELKDYLHELYLSDLIIKMDAFRD